MKDTQALKDFDMEATQVSINRWMNEHKVVYTYDRILTSLKKKILTRATTWISLKDTMLSEISQSQKDKYCYDSAHMKYLE